MDTQIHVVGDRAEKLIGQQGNIIVVNIDLLIHILQGFIHCVLIDIAWESH